MNRNILIFCMISLIFSASLISADVLNLVKDDKAVTPAHIGISMPQKWRITDINDTELFYDIDSVSYDGSKFTVDLKAVDEIKTIPVNAIEIEPITIDDNITVIEKPIKAQNKETVNNIVELKEKLSIQSRDYERNMDIKTINFFDDYDRNTGLRTYNFDLLADYTVNPQITVEYDYQDTVGKALTVRHLS